MKLLAWGLTDVGLKRDHNEDAAAADMSVGMVALADGMGGYNAGEVAAEEPSIVFVSRRFESFSPPAERTRAVELAVEGRLLIRAQGGDVRTLVDATVEAGQFSVSWDGRDDLGVQVASAVYYYRIDATDFTQTRKMVLLK